MNDDRQLRRLGLIELAAEYALLQIGRHVIVVVVESHLAPADDARMFCELFELRESFLGNVIHVVRMDTHRGVDPVMLLGERMAASRRFVPVPLPMARMLFTPTARARSSMAARSSSNCGNSRCACESMISKGMIFYPSIKIAKQNRRGILRCAQNDGAKLKQRQNQM